MHSAAADLPTSARDAGEKASGFDGFLLGGIGVFVFGLTLPMTHLALDGFDPVTVGLGRAVVAGVIAALVLAACRVPRPSRPQIVSLAIVSAGVVIGFPLLATVAMVYVPAGHGGIVIAILPLTTAAAAVVFAGERPSIGFWVCAIAGSAAVAAFSVIEGFALGDASAADLLLIGATICASIGYAQGAVLARDLGGWQVICWALVIAQPILVPAVWLFGAPMTLDGLAAIPAHAWAGFIYIALGSQFLAFFAWNAGLARGGVARVGQLQLLQTFVTLAGAALLLGEELTVFHLGFALLVVAIVAIGKRMAVARPAARR